MPLTADLNIRKNITFVALPILYPQVDPLNLRLGLGEVVGRIVLLKLEVSSFGYFLFAIQVPILKIIFVSYMKKMTSVKFCGHMW